MIDKLSKVILSGVSKLIGAESPEPFDVQNAAYNVIAQLARTCPEIMNKDLQLVSAYFDHLAVAPSELHTSIREALVSLAPAFSWRFGVEKDTALPSSFTPSSTQIMLLAMFAQHVESKMQIVQNVASVFLTTCYPDHFVPARYLLLILAGEKSSLSEVVLSYLYGVAKKDHINFSFISSVDHQADRPVEAVSVNQLSTEQRRIVLPSFPSMVNYVFEQTQKRDAGAAPKHSYGKVVLSYTYEAFTEILEYIRLCLWFSAGASTAPGDPKSAQLLRQYLEKLPDTVIDRYLGLVKKILVAKRGRTELSCLYDLLDVLPAKYAPPCADLLEGFDAGLKDVSDGTRTLVAQVQGILLANGTADAEFNERVKDMLQSLSQRSLEHRHGSILTIAHAFQRKIQRVRAEQSALDESTFAKWESLKLTTNLLSNLTIPAHVDEIA